MTMNGVPQHLHLAFKEWMDAWNDDDLPDGAWWAVLEDGARAFGKEYKLKNIDAFECVHLYLRLLKS